MNIETKDAIVESSATQEQNEEQIVNQNIDQSESLSQQGNADASDNQEIISGDERKEPPIKNLIGENKRLLEENRRILEEMKIERARTEGMFQQQRQYQTQPQYQQPVDIYAEERQQAMKEFKEEFGVGDDTALRLANGQLSRIEKMNMRNAQFLADKFADRVNQIEYENLLSKEELQIEKLINKKPELEKYVNSAMDILNKTDINYRKTQGAKWIADAVLAEAQRRSGDLEKKIETERQEGVKEGMTQRRIIGQTQSVNASRSSSGNIKLTSQELAAAYKTGEAMGWSKDESIKKYIEGRQRQKENGLW